MTKCLKYFFIISITIMLAAILTATIGVKIPRQISQNNNFIGIVAGHIYADNATDTLINDKDLRTCYFLLGHGGGVLAALGSKITQRMAITGARDLETGNCGACSAKLYTVFNIRYLHAARDRDCSA